HPLLDILALPKPTNCSHETIISPACCPLSNPTFPSATYATVDKLPVMLNTVSYPHCQFPPVPGNLFHVTLSPICHHQTVSILSLSLLIDSQRCHTSPLVKDGQPRSGPVLGPAQCIEPTIFEMESDRTNQSVH